MKKNLITIFSAFCLLSSAFAQTAPILFPLNSLFGGAAYGKTITIAAANTLISDGFNLWAGTYQNVPWPGTNPVVNLYPNTYLLTVPGVVKPARFRVYPSDVGTNIINVVSRLTSGPLFYFGPTNGLANFNAGTGIALVTNADGSITISSGGNTPLLETYFNTNLTLTALSSGTNYWFLGDTSLGNLSLTLPTNWANSFRVMLYWTNTATVPNTLTLLAPSGFQFHDSTVSNTAAYPTSITWKYARDSALFTLSGTNIEITDKTVSGAEQQTNATAAAQLVYSNNAAGYGTTLAGNNWNGSQIFYGAIELLNGVIDGNLLFGTSGQVLQSRGVGQPPIWTTPASTGLTNNQTGVTLGGTFSGTFTGNLINSTNYQGSNVVGAVAQATHTTNADFVNGTLTNNTTGNAATSTLATTATTALNGVTAGQSNILSAALTNGDTRATSFPNLNTTPMWTTPGLAAYLTADSFITYTSGVAITNWPDLSGNGRSLGSASGTVTYNAQGVAGRPGVQFANGLLLNTNFFTSAMGTNFSLFVVCSTTQAGNLLDSDTNLTFAFRFIPNYGSWDQINVHELAGASHLVPPCIQYGQTACYGMTFNGTTFTLWNNQRPVEVSTYEDSSLVNQSMNFLPVLNLGNDSSRFEPYFGSVAGVFLYSNCLNTAQSVAIEKYLTDKYTRPVNEILLDGDSIMTSVLSTHNTQPCDLLYSYIGGYDIETIAHGSRNFGNMVTNQPLWVTTKKTGKSVILLHDNASNGQDGTSLSFLTNNFILYCATAHANGYLVVASTPLSWQFETSVRTNFCTWLEQNWTNYADALADSSMDTNMGVWGSHTNSLYFGSDQTHPTALGYTNLLNNYWVPALNRVLNINPNGATFTGVDIPTNALGTHGYTGYMTNGIFVTTGTY